jgi:hypothetical protein
MDAGHGSHARESGPCGAGGACVASPWSSEVGDVSLVGDVDRSAPTWRIFAVRAGAAVMRAVEIRAAYY